ncbi:MAG: hypothetical protein AMS27_05785 [Bacteroides sp. SM23_62_1]|nr:MAG: hypothetical protein AMS27_05785 [Bacteroides sp. SM23_62_1]
MKTRIILVVCLQLISIYIVAQIEQQMVPSEMKQLTAITEPATLMKGFFRVGMVYDHAFVKKLYDENANKIVLPGSSLSQTRALSITLQYGITDRFQVNLLLPFEFDLIQQSALWEDPLFRQKTIATWNQKGVGIGDLSFGLNSQIIKESDQFPSITAFGLITVPTGRKDITNVVDQRNYDLPTGSGEIRLSLDLQARKIVYPYSFIFIASIEYPLGGEKILSPGGEKTSFKSGQVYRITGGVNFHLNDWLSMANNLDYQYISEAEIDNNPVGYNPWALQYHPYFHFQIRRLRFIQSVLIPLKGKYYSADPHYNFILQFII